MKGSTTRAAKTTSGCSRRHGSWSHAEFLRAEEFRRRLEAEDAAVKTTPRPDARRES